MEYRGFQITRRMFHAIPGTVVYVACKGDYDTGDMIATCDSPITIMRHVDEYIATGRKVYRPAR